MFACVCVFVKPHLLAFRRVLQAVRVLHVLIVFYMVFVGAWQVSGFRACAIHFYRVE